VTILQRHVHFDGDDLVIELEGDIDHHVVRELFDQLCELIDSAGEHRLVIDMAGVAFLGSSGIRVLLRANALSPAFAVRSLRPQLQRVIDIIAPGILTVEP
jgi:anti-anti-sigma factor